MPHIFDSPVCLAIWFQTSNRNIFRPEYLTENIETIEPNGGRLNRTDTQLKPDAIKLNCDMYDFTMRKRNKLKNSRFASASESAKLFYDWILKNHGKLIFGVRYTSLLVEEYVLIQAEVVSRNEFQCKSENEKIVQKSKEPSIKIEKVFTFNQFALCNQSDSEESDSEDSD